MHSGAEISGGSPWGFTIGNWGVDDGIGQMENIGTDLWKITIHPQSYYGYPGGSTLDKIQMVFRNQDTLIGKDGSNNDIVLEMAFDPPVDTFSGAWTDWKRSAFASVLWSDGSSDPTLAVSSAGNYWVLVTDTNGCSATDSVEVNIASLPIVDLGADTALCDGGTVLLDAGPGFTSYFWSDSSTLQTNSLTIGGTYSVTVTNSAGCEGVDIVNIDINNSPVADFTFSGSSFTVNFTDASTDGVDYQWDFTSDGSIDDSGVSASFTYSGPGVFTVTLIVTNECGADTISKLVPVPLLAIEDEDLELQLSVGPNPVLGILNIGFESAFSEPVLGRLVTVFGELVKEFEIRVENGLGDYQVDVNGFSSGVYVLEIVQGERRFTKLLVFR